MMYGVEAVIPIEISLSSMRVVDFSQSDNDVRMVGNLDTRRKDETWYLFSLRIISRSWLGGITGM